MKIIFFCFILAVAESLMPIRIDSRKQQTVEGGFEFGRQQVIDRDAKDDLFMTLEEMNFLQARLLQTESSMSLPTPTFSPVTLPTATFSPATLPPVTTVPGESMAPVSTAPDLTPAPVIAEPKTVEPTPEILPKTRATCIHPDITNSPSMMMPLRLEVDTSTPSIDLGELSSGMISAVSNAFSLCLPDARRLKDRDVIGFDTMGQPTIIGTCDAETAGAVCHLVGTEFVVYATSFPPEPAGAHVLSELEKQAESGSLVKDYMSGTGIIAMRVKKEELEQPLNAESGQNSSNGSNVGLIAGIVIGGILCISLIIAFFKRSRRQYNRGEIMIHDSKSDSSTITGHTGRTTQQPSVVPDDSSQTVWA